MNKIMLSKAKAIIRFIITVSRSPGLFLLIVARVFRPKPLDIDNALENSVKWLLSAYDESPDGGFSRLYSLTKKRWDVGYIETTGYIIETMMVLYQQSKDSKYLEYALNSANWLLSRQDSTGYFPSSGNNPVPMVFDTGQCLLGLLALIKSDVGSKEKYIESATRAAAWLVAMQNPDGSWTNHTYMGAARTYYSKVGSALLDFGVTMSMKEYIEAGRRNVEWVLEHQDANGFFLKSGFSENNHVLHTMMYVNEGLIHAYQILRDDKYVEAVISNIAPLVEEVLSGKGVPSSFYDKDYRALDDSKCLTGLAQWSIICLRLFEYTKDERYSSAAKLSLLYLRARQIPNGKKLSGALLGSYPPNGAYMPFSAPNWASKYFVDGILLLKKNCQIDDSEILWRNISFHKIAPLMPRDLTESDQINLSALSMLLSEREGSMNVLDLGAGSGRMMKQIRAKHPNVSLYGVDPQFFDGKDICKGDAGDMPFDDGYFDIIYTIEVLQHVTDLSLALGNITRKLKPGGRLVIIDRNPFSSLYLLKPYYELKGKWMYDVDSPVKEEWRTVSCVEKLISEMGFKLVISKSYTTKGRLPFFNRFYIAIFEVKSE